MEQGHITSVTYTDGVVKCNVNPVRVSNEYRNVPVMKSYAGLTRMPRPGQKVAMDELDDGTRVIIGYIAREESYPNELASGELTIQVDDDTKVELVKNGDNWDLNLSASGNITIDGIDFDEHTHDYEDELSDGSTTTKTTNKPQ